MSNKYTSEDYIRDVIESGTAYERVRLLATSVAHWAYQNEPIEPPLTPEQHAQLQASFRSQGDKQVLDKYRTVDNLVQLYIVQLSQYLIEHDLILSHFNHFAIMRATLNQDIPDLCDVIGKVIAKRFGWKTQVEIFYEASKSKPLPTFFGYKPKLEVDVDEETGEFATFSFPDLYLPDTSGAFDQILNTYGNRLSKTRRTAKANIEVLQEIMKAERFNIKPYKHFLKKAEKRLRQEPELTNLIKDFRYMATEVPNKPNHFASQLADDYEKKRKLLWHTYDEIKITDEDKATLRKVANQHGVSYAKS